MNAIFWSAIFLVAGVAAFYWATLRLSNREAAAVAAVGVFVAGFATSELLAAIMHATASPTPVAVQSAVARAGTPADGVVSIALLGKLRGDAVGFIDTVELRETPSSTLEPVNDRGVPLASRLQVTGWICGPDYKPGTAVFAIVDGWKRIDLPNAYGRERGDVAGYFSKPGLQNVGYRFILPARARKPGLHKLQVAVVSAAQTGFYVLPKAFSLTILRT